MFSFSQRLFAQDPFNFSTAQTSILMAYAAFLQISGQQPMICSAFDQALITMEQVEQEHLRSHIFQLWAIHAAPSHTLLAQYFIHS